ncbi:MAG: replication-associated recombination protein A [Christensenellales bacterium]
MTNVPLAERMRPETLEDFVGQEHLIGEGKLLTRAIKFGAVSSMIFYGPPGTGKTTLANIIAKTLKGEMRKLNAVSSGVADAKEIIAQARKEKAMFGTQTYLMLDECHRWNKAQSDSVLEAIEDGSIIFIGSTTENPYTSMTRAIVSRCRIFEFKPITQENIVNSLKKALEDKEKGFGIVNVKATDEALNHLAWASGGDLRTAYNALELAVNTTPLNKNLEVVIDLDVAQNSIQKRALSFDDTLFYDYLSAFCKSIRGSDTEAALYYCHKMIESGVDPLIISRRLMVHASEDIGMADSNALLLATSAHYALEKMGVPEGLIPLSHAIIYACEAEKSNSVIIAMGMAREDAVKAVESDILSHLKNRPQEGKAKYKYPHDFGGYVKQQYMPNEFKDKVYYTPSGNGKERNLKRKKVF